MTPSVSFILPVNDLHFGLRDRIFAILEVLPELTDHFDVLLVDYSRYGDLHDMTYELVKEYPQVDLISRPNANIFDAIEAGIDATQGEIIFIHDHSMPLGITALKSLWAMRGDDDLVMAQSRSNDQKAPMHVDFASREEDVQNRTSIQMIRRCAMPSNALDSSSTRETVDRLTRTDVRDDPEMTRLPKLLSRLRRLANQQ